MMTMMLFKMPCIDDGDDDDDDDDDLKGDPERQRLAVAGREGPQYGEEIEEKVIIVIILLILIILIILIVIKITTITTITELQNSNSFTISKNLKTKF